MRISDWSSDVCSSDLHVDQHRTGRAQYRRLLHVLQQVFHEFQRLQLDAQLPMAERPAAAARQRRQEIDAELGIARIEIRVAGGAILVLDPEQYHLQIGRAHVSTPVTNTPLVSRLLLVNKKSHIYTPYKMHVIT